MSLKFFAHRHSAKRAIYTVPGLKMAISPAVQKRLNAYTPRQSSIAGKSLVVTGSAVTTILVVVGHKMVNTLILKGIFQ